MENKGKDLDAIVADLFLPQEPREYGATTNEESASNGWVVLSNARIKNPTVCRVAISRREKPERAKWIAMEYGIPFLDKATARFEFELADLVDRLVGQKELDKAKSMIYSDEVILDRMKRLVDFEVQYPNMVAPTLLVGETGSGKGHFAQEIHQERVNRGICEKAHFKDINCAALGEGNALLVQLFGALPGFYSGTADVPGLLELTDQTWTVFFDEIGKIGKNAQGALLKIIDTSPQHERLVQRFPFVDVFPKPLTQTLSQSRRPSQPADSQLTVVENELNRMEGLVKSRFPSATRYHQGYLYNEPKPFAGHIVAATNVDLGDLVRKDQFLPDLYNRLMCFTIRLPSLRERGPQYTKDLAASFVGNYNKEVDRSALDVLANHLWNRGNRRELQHTLEAAVIAAGSGTVIRPEHIHLVEGL